LFGPPSQIDDLRHRRFMNAVLLGEQPGHALPLRLGALGPASQLINARDRKLSGLPFLLE
jgi:hypothetical protein